MAHDRANDSKRVPSLGISEPKSHVKVVPAPTHKYLRHPMRDEKVKVDAFRESDGMRNLKSRSTIEDREIEHKDARERGMVPVVKIDSSK
jgi:hypothetical protein